MATPLRVLMLEDQPADAELLLSELRRAGFAPVWERVETEMDYRAHLHAGLDVILADYVLPQFDAVQALQIMKERGLDLPFIVVSGTISDETAVECMKQGAADYLLNDRLARLGQAVIHALHETRVRQERQQAEAALRASEAHKAAILDSAIDGIITIDQAGTIIEFNTAAERLFGIPRTAAVGQPMVELIIPPSLRERHRRGLAHYLATGAGPILGTWLETLALHADGTEFPIEISTTRVGAEEPVLFTGFLRDISERKHAEAALQAKNDELRAMSAQLWQAAKLATMGELAASIAHELNNPLATVMLRIESLLAQANVDTPQWRALTVIEQEVERMGQLVANLLHFSRHSQPQRASVDVREELENTLALIQYHLRNHRITVIRQFAPKLPPVHADRQQLRQVFLNLVTNASDAMPQGGTLTLEVSMGLQESDVHAVVMTFTDTGVGIAPADMPKVMEPFFTTKPEGQGTGLGLSICRRIVHEHGGTMELRSTLGQGTTICLALPIRED